MDSETRHHPFHCRDGILHAENVPLPAIAAAVGTPVYVYSSAALRLAARTFRAGLAQVPRKHLAFAVKANPNIAALRLLAEEGYGADIVSGGGMLHALAAGMPPESIVFSGVGKTRVELVAAVDAGIGQFNLELEEEGVGLYPDSVDRAPETARLSQLRHAPPCRRKP